MFKFLQWLLVSLFIVMFTACGGSGTDSDDGAEVETITTYANTITGNVDLAQAGLKVYLQFSDNTKSTETTTNDNGDYNLTLSLADLEKINPIIPDGADGPKDDVLIVVEKDGRVLRNGLERDVSNGKVVNITSDTESYAVFLETIGEYSVSALTTFNQELDSSGHVKKSSDYYTFITSFNSEVREYFRQDTDLPSKNNIFENAMNNLGKELLSSLSDNSSYVPHREIMSGGDILLSSNITAESDDITLISKGNGRFTVGDGTNGDLTIYLKVIDDDVYRLIPLSVKEKQVTLLASSVVTPQKGTNIGSDQDSISATIPPYALLSNKTISFNKIESQGTTTDGKMILDMQPSGLKFDLPITIKVKYSDFGVTNPEAVEWKYGSIDGSYEDADIVSIDVNSGLITLNISHFSNLVAREIKNQKYLDLAEKFIVHIPRRNHNLVPTSTNKSMIQEEKLIISNRLFEGASTSNLQGSDSTPAGGGQCVQFADNVYYPLKIGKKLNIPQAYISKTSGLMRTIYDSITDNSTLPEGVRANSNSCREGDVVAVDSGGGTGHIATYKNYANNKLYLIQSNDRSDVLAMYGSKKEYKTDTASYHERFTFGNVHGNKNTTYAISGESGNYTMTKPSNPSNTFICLDPVNYDFDEIDYNSNDYRTVFVDGEKTGNGTTNDTFATTYGYSVNAKPWMYYLLDTEGDGVSITKEKGGAQYYGYEPDILPVAPLKLDTNYQLTSDVESRYEIYVSDVFNNEFRLTGFSNSESQELEEEKYIVKTDTTLSFGGNSLKKLKQNNTDKTEFKLVPQNGVENFKSRYELRTATQETSVDNNKKVLFSPTVIDDYYVNWSKDNVYDTSKILIGFWNEYGYNMTLANENGVLPTTLQSGRIYKSTNAVNGYFMTLADGKSAEWHFSLAGAHAIFVHVPTGKYTDIQAAKYEYKDVNGETITLKARTLSEKLPDSSFENWFVLYEEKDGKKNYKFDLGGSESIKVTANGGTIVVDALRLQGRESLIEDIVTIKGTATISDQDDINNLFINVKFLDENNKVLAEKCMNPSDAENLNLNIDKKETLGDKIFALFFTTAYAPSNECFNSTQTNQQPKTYKKSNLENAQNNSGSSSAFKIKEDVHKKSYKETNSTAFLSYQPAKISIDISKSESEVQLPKVILRKLDFVDNFTFNVTDTNGITLSGVNVDIKYGSDSDSELVVYGGITDNSGQFTINNLAYGQYTAVLSSSGYAPQMVNFTVSNDVMSKNVKLIEATGSTLEGTWIADSNDVPTVPQATYKESINIKSDGSNYLGTYKSVYSWYPDEYCGLITSISEADFIATVNGEYLDLTFTSDSGNARTECDGSWVNAPEYVKGQQYRLNLNSNDSGILSLGLGGCGWSHDGVCVQEMPLFYKFNTDENEYPDPEAKILGIDYNRGGDTYTVYDFKITNANAYPENTFDPLPNTPSSCGDAAPRFFLQIHDQNDNYIYGYCALNSLDSLSLGTFWFAIEKNNTSITGVKIKMYDRAKEKYYSSQVLSLKDI